MTRNARCRAIAPRFALAALAALGGLVPAAPLPAQSPVLPGMCFGPFRDGEAPGVRAPLPSALRADLATVQRVAARIRTYGMGGTGMLVPELCDEVGLPCWPGAWISGDRAADDLECELLERAAKRFPRTVEAVVVGNEALLRHDVDETTLWRRVAAVRRSLQDAGLETRVGTAEPWSVWLDHPDFARALDVVVVHVYPYWDGIAVEDAARYTIDRLDAVRAMAKPTPVVLGEFGWPTAGDAKGAAVPSPANAARYLKEVLPLLRARDDPFFAFEMWDEAWKANAEGSVGPHWGLFGRDGAPKPELAAAVPGLERGASTRPPRRTDPDLRQPGKGDDRVPAAVAALLPIVEREAGLAFRAPPRVRVPDDFEWRDIVRGEMPRAQDPSLAEAITLGLFLPDAGEVVLSTVVGSYLARDASLAQDGWDPSRVDAEARGAWLVVAHELVHVLQEQHFGLPTRMRATADRPQKVLLRALLEGHAISVETRLAAALFGIDTWATRVLPRRYAATSPEMQGLLFVQRIRETGGDAAVHAALGERPPTPAEFGRTVNEAVRAQRAAKHRGM